MPAPTEYAFNWRVRYLGQNWLPGSSTYLFNAPALFLATRKLRRRAEGGADQDSSPRDGNCTHWAATPYSCFSRHSASLFFDHASKVLFKFPHRYGHSPKSSLHQLIHPPPASTRPEQAWRIKPTPTKKRHSAERGRRGLPLHIWTPLPLESQITLRLRCFQCSQVPDC